MKVRSAATPDHSANICAVWRLTAITASMSRARSRNDQRGALASKP
jgi:hypothetical protein